MRNENKLKSVPPIRLLAFPSTTVNENAQRSQVIPSSATTLRQLDTYPCQWTGNESTGRSQVYARKGEIVKRIPAQVPQNTAAVKIQKAPSVEKKKRGLSTAAGKGSRGFGTNGGG